MSHSEDASVKQSNEALQEASHSQKATSKLRNVGGYLLNKLTKPKSIHKSTSIPSKKRKNFFSLFDREHKNSTVSMQISPLETKIEHTVIPDEHVEPNLFKTEENSPVNTSGENVPTLNHSYALAKIKAAPKRKINPRTNPVRTDSKLETINESTKFKFDSNQSDFFKSNNSLNKLVEKANQNFQTTKIPSSNSSHMVENIVKITNELNLDQEKTLSSEPNSRFKKSINYTSSPSILMENSSSYSDTNHMHIYDNSTFLICHYDSTLSDASTDSPQLNTPKKKVMLSCKDSQLVNENNNNSNDCFENRVVVLRAKFSNETKNSKSFEGLDTILLNKRETQQENIVNECIEQIEEAKSKKCLRYSKSLKLSQNSTQISNQIDSPIDESALIRQASGNKVSIIINNLTNSCETTWKETNNKKKTAWQSNKMNDPNNQKEFQTNLFKTESFEPGKVKSLVKNLEK